MVSIQALRVSKLKLPSPNDLAMLSKTRFRMDSVAAKDQVNEGFYEVKSLLMTFLPVPFTVLKM